MSRLRVRVIDDDEDPLNGVANLFDAAMVFAVALLVAILMAHNMPELLDPDASFTMIKNPGEPDMQIIIKDQDKIEVMNVTDMLAGGEGEKMGVAYRLRTGEMIYVPENATESE